MSTYHVRRYRPRASLPRVYLSSVTSCPVVSDVPYVQRSVLPYVNRVRRSLCATFRPALCESFRPALCESFRPSSCLHPMFRPELKFVFRFISQLPLFNTIPEYLYSKQPGFYSPPGTEGRYLTGNLRFLPQHFGPSVVRIFWIV